MQAQGGSRQAEQEAIEAAVTEMAKAMFEAAHPGVHLQDVENADADNFVPDLDDDYDR